MSRIGRLVQVGVDHAPHFQGEFQKHFGWWKFNSIYIYSNLLSSREVQLVPDMIYGPKSTWLESFASPSDLVEALNFSEVERLN